MSLLRDINKNVSSKRVAAYTIGVVVLAAFVADGFELYSVNENIATAFIAAMTTLLGIGTFEKKQ